MTKDEALNKAMFMATDIRRGITPSVSDAILLFQACKEALEQRDLYSEIKEGLDALKHQSITYEQPQGWMQQLVSETDGKKTIRYTFTKTRIGNNDIPIYFEEALRNKNYG